MKKTTPQLTTDKSNMNTLISLDKGPGSGKYMITKATGQARLIAVDRATGQANLIAVDRATGQANLIAVDRATGQANLIAVDRATGQANLIAVEKMTSRISFTKRSRKFRINFNRFKSVKLLIAVTAAFTALWNDQYQLVFEGFKSLGRYLIDYLPSISALITL